MKLLEKTIEKKNIYNGKIINLRTDTALLPDGSIALREVVEHPGGVCVAALTDRDELLLVRQFRYPYGEIIYELPAGKRDPKEDPLECGRRELKEETGAAAGRFELLGQFYPTPGYCNEIIYMYAAFDLTFSQPSPDADEFLVAEKVPFDRAVEMVMSNEIKDGKTQAAVLKLKIMLDRKKQS